MKKDHSLGGEIIWNPTPKYIQRSHLKRFMSLHQIESFAKLHARSVEDIAWFTDSVIRYLDIQFQSPYRQVLNLNRGIEFPGWCVGGKLNIVENCVDKWIANPDSRNRPAIIWEGEEGRIGQLTYGELFKVVNQCANALRELGLGKGDFIGLYMPMTLEACIALLACAKIGAVCLPLFSGYGAGALVSRLGHAKIKALFTADGFFRRGRVTPMKSVADQAAEEIPTLKHLIVLKRTGIEVGWRQGRDHWWHELIPSQREDTLPAQTRCRRYADAHLYFGNNGKTQGSCAYALQLSNKSRAGYGFWDRRSAGRRHSLVLRYGLDDGTMACFWCDDSWSNLLHLRWRIGLSGARPLVVTGRATQNQRFGNLPYPHTVLDSLWRRTGQSAQPLFYSSVCLYGRTLESRSLDVAVRDSW